MKKLEEQNSALNRRDLMKSAAAAGVVYTAGTQGTPSLAAAPAADNLIRQENAKPGTRDWQLTKTRQLPGKVNKILNNGRCPSIEGYCSANSVRAGTSAIEKFYQSNP